MHNNTEHSRMMNYMIIKLVYVTGWIESAAMQNVATLYVIARLVVESSKG